MTHSDEHGSSGDGVRSEMLAATVSALVDGSFPEGVRTAPERNLKSLRRTVRRWRMAKAGAIGGTSLVAVGLVTVGATQLPVWDGAEPLPAGPPSVSPSPTADPTPEPDADEITAPFEEGHTPARWAGSPATSTAYCGMPVGELGTDGGLEIAITGDPAPIDAGGQEILGTPVSIEWTGGASDDAVRGMGSPRLVWSQGGVVVDLGAGWSESATDIQDALNADGVWSGPATSQPFTTCVPEADGESYTTPRAAGTYEVRAVAPYSAPSGDGREDYLAVSEPVIITVP